MIIMERMYMVYKDGQYAGHNVGFLYIISNGISNKDEKIQRLKDDYPEHEGYELKLLFDEEV